MSIHKKIKGAKPTTWLTDGFSKKELKLILFKSEISTSIQVQRKRLGLSQTELAEKLGVTQGLVSRWENGEENITLETLANIAAALGLELKNPLSLSVPAYKYARKATPIRNGKKSSPDIDYDPIREKAIKEAKQ